MSFVRTAFVLAALLIAIALVPMASAQGGRGGAPFRIEWTTPETAAKNHTLDLDSNGTGVATFRIGYRPSNFPVGGTTCGPGSKIEVPLLVSNTDLPGFAGVSIAPNKATWDVSASPSVPTMGGSAYRWSEKHELAVNFAVENITLATLVQLNVTHGPIKLVSGNCAPAAPSTTRMAAESINATFVPPPKPAAAPAPTSKEGFTIPGPEFVTLVALVGLVIGLRRRAA